MAGLRFEVRGIVAGKARIVVEHVTRLRQEHRLLKTDREYLENVARDRLNMQREGEYIIRIEREDEP